MSDRCRRVFEHDTMISACLLAKSANNPPYERGPCPHFAHIGATIRVIWRYRKMRVFAVRKQFQLANLCRVQNHDFFSGSGSSYVIGKAVNTEDSDWDF